MSWDVSVIRFELQVIRQLPDAIWHSKNHKKSMTSHFGGSTTDQMILGPVVPSFFGAMHQMHQDSPASAFADPVAPGRSRCVPGKDATKRQRCSYDGA